MGELYSFSFVATSLTFAIYSILKYLFLKIENISL